MCFYRFTPPEPEGSRSSPRGRPFQRSLRRAQRSQEEESQGRSCSGRRWRTFQGLDEICRFWQFGVGTLELRVGKLSHVFFVVGFFRGQFLGVAMVFESMSKRSLGLFGVTPLATPLTNSSLESHQNSGQEPCPHVVV